VTAANATSCVITSSPKLKSLPKAIDCRSGTGRDSVRIPVDPYTQGRRFRFAARAVHFQAKSTTEYRWITQKGEPSVASPLGLSGLIAGSPAAAGETLFLDYGCTSCHIVKGVGGQVGPNLTKVGLHTRSATYAGRLPVLVPGVMGPISRGQDWYILELECPLCVTPNSPMPPFAKFTPQQYEDLSACSRRHRTGTTRTATDMSRYCRSVSVFAILNIHSLR
jgi:hypothetical protein